MDKTLIIINWFKNNNDRLTNTLLFKLCYYANVMLNIVNINTCSDTLKEDEIKVLKIVNRVFGYTKEEYLQIEDNINFIEYIKEIYDCYKDAELNERVEFINGKYFFINENIAITKEEHEELKNICDEEDNLSYYVSRDTKGFLVVY